MFNRNPKKKQLQKQTPAPRAAAAAFLTILSQNKIQMRCVHPKGRIQLNIWKNGYDKHPFLSSPPYHGLYRVKHRTTNYRRVTKPTDGCNPTMSHGSMDVFQSEDGGIRLTESIMPGDFNPFAWRMPNYGCTKSKLITDAWNPKWNRWGAVAANHH
jgi:hypothetical protein